MKVDFNHARARLAEAQARLEGELDAVEMRAILEVRAHKLARRDLRQEEVGEVYGEFIVVRRENVDLGLPVSSVEEIRRVVVSVLPHATRVLQGLFQIRGQAYCLTDLLTFFDREAHPAAPSETLAALVEGAPGPLGLRIDEVIAPRTIYAHEINPDLKEHAADCVVAVTRDLVHLLDVEALLADSAVRMEAS